MDGRFALGFWGVDEDGVPLGSPAPFDICCCGGLGGDTVGFSAIAGFGFFCYLLGYRDWGKFDSWSLEENGRCSKLMESLSISHN